VNFATEMASLAKRSIVALAEVFRECSRAFPPVPSRPHYTFNLRDVAAVVGGVLLATPAQVPDAKAYASLWLHEVLRVFGDRLVAANERRDLEEICVDAMRRAGLTGLGLHTDAIFGPTSFDAWGLVWTDLHLPGARTEGGPVYVPVRQRAALPGQLEELQANAAGPVAAAGVAGGLATMQYGTGQLDMVLVPSVARRVCRLLRVLRRPRGHALLLGVPGTGKRAIVRLAAGLCSSHLACLAGPVTAAGFRECLGDLYTLCGIEQRHVTLLLSDADLANDELIEDVTTLLGSCDIPNLFPTEQREKLTSAVLDAVRSTTALSRQEAYQLFLTRVQANLHVTLCCPLDDAFHRRCVQFPALVTRTNVSWVDAWTDAELNFIAQRLFEDQGFDVTISAANMAAAAAAIHAASCAEAPRLEACITPATYLQFLRARNAMHRHEHDRLSQLLHRAGAGIARMAEAQSMVATMELKIRELEPAVVNKRGRVEELMVDLTHRKAAAEQVALIVESQRTLAAEEALVARDLKAEAEHDLAQAQPELLEALRSLKALQKADIDEIKKYSVPPSAVLLTIEAVLTLLREKKPADWSFAKSVVGSARFVERLYNFNVESLDEPTISRMQKFVRDPDFTPERVGTQGSDACRSLCKWALATEHYYHVHRRVEPKRQALAHAERAAAVAQASLLDAEAKLRSAQGQLRSLEEYVTAGRTELKALEDETARCQRRLIAAVTLTDNLGGERQRWAAMVASRQHDLAHLHGTVLVTAAFAVYAGGFPGAVRADLLRQWCEIAAANSIAIAAGTVDVVAALAPPMDRRAWIQATLPSDATSVQNAAIVREAASSRGRCWPLAVDPQQQATNWLRALLPGSTQIKPSDPKFLPQLKAAVSNGRTVVITEFESRLVPMLAPLLQREITLDHGVAVVTIGGESVEYHREFALYLITALPIRTLPADLWVATRVVNFSVTRQGLAQQCLSDIVGREHEALERESLDNIKIAADAQDRLDAVELRVLQLLETAAEGNILDNVGLIHELTQSRHVSADLNAVIALQQAQREALDAQRGVYEPAAQLVARLYFVAAAAERLDPMYAINLAFVQRVYRTVLSRDTKKDTLDRVPWLQGEITLSLLSALLPMMFERHRLPLALLAALERAVLNGDVQERDLTTFCELDSAADALPAEEHEINIRPTWATELSWRRLLVLERSVAHVFAGLRQHMADEAATWKEWAASCTADGRTTLPQRPRSGATAGGHSMFYDLLLTHAAFPQRTTLFAPRVVSSILSAEVLDLQVFNPATALSTARCTMPLIVIAGEGSDPVPELQRFAASCGQADMACISLGRGQEAIAANAVKSAMVRGRWVMLQNCHLSRSFVNGDLLKLASALCEYRADKKTAPLNIAADEPVAPTLTMIGAVAHCHPDFRLILTTARCDFLPPAVLHACARFACEPPVGLRSHILRGFTAAAAAVSFSAHEVMLDGGRKQDAFLALTYGIAVLHGVLLGRRRFGAMGWTKAYDFSDVDREMCCLFIRRALQEAKAGVPWAAIRQIVGGVHYAGRITDADDLRVLGATVDTIINERLLTSPSPGEALPRGSTLERPSPQLTYSEYTRHIQAQLGHGEPTDDPACFGLHPAAVADADSLVAADFTFSLRAVASSVPNNVVRAADVLVDESTARTLDHFFATVPGELAMDDAHPSLVAQDTAGRESPLTTCLFHEIRRMNTLVAYVKRSLGDLRDALSGTVVMAETGEHILRCIATAQVPTPWTALAFESDKPLSAWFRDVQRRMTFLKQWLAGGEPESFWLGGLHQPSALLVAAMQRYAVRRGVPITAVTMVAEVQGDDAAAVTADPDTLQLHGLYSEGFQWQDGRMGEIPGDSPTLRLPFPVLRLRIVEAAEHSARDAAETFTCAIYATSNRISTIRPNLICRLPLASRHPPSHWVLAGAALVAATPQ
jgi:dynein heavy chain